MHERNTGLSLEPKSFMFDRISESGWYNWLRDWVCWHPTVQSHQDRELRLAVLMVQGPECRDWRLTTLGLSLLSQLVHVSPPSSFLPPFTTTLTYCSPPSVTLLFIRLQISEPIVRWCERNGMNWNTNNWERKRMKLRAEPRVEVNTAPD